MSPSAALIAGIVVCIVAFNGILAISWCILRDRKKIKKLHKRKISDPIDCEIYENSLAFKIRTGALPAAIPVYDNTSAQGAERESSYVDLISAMQRQPGRSSEPPSPSCLSHDSSRNSTDSAGLSKFVLRPQDMKELSGVPLYPKAKSLCNAQTARQSSFLEMPAKPDLKRANSYAPTETASMYSSASAPIDYHEQLFRTQPFALDPDARLWVGELPNAPRPAVASNRASMELDIRVLSPTTSQEDSDDSETATIVPYRERLSPPPSPTLSTLSIPSSSAHTHSFQRFRTQSGPSQLHWITPVAPAVSPKRTRRPTSISSLSTIYSLRDGTRVPAVTPITVAPLNAWQRSDDPQRGFVELTRSTPLPSAAYSQPVAPPALPPRSPRRPPPSASVEYLPVTAMIERR